MPTNKEKEIYKVELSEMSIESEIIRSEVISQLYETVESLPTKQKKIIKLLYFESKPVSAISKMLGISSKNVLDHKYSAMKRLRSLLPDYFVESRISTADYGKPEIISVKADEINGELIRHLAKHPHKMYDLDPFKFEKLVAELLRDMGYDVFRTVRTHDGGMDIIAVIKVPPNIEIITIVECKRQSERNKVELSDVRSFMWTIQNSKANAGRFVTTSFFPSGVHAIKKDYNCLLHLDDFNNLSQYLMQYGQWQQSKGLWLPNNPLSS